MTAKHNIIIIQELLISLANRKMKNKIRKNYTLLFEVELAFTWC